MERSARCGTNTAGELCGRRIRTVPNCPGLSGPPPLSIWASTVKVRDVGETFGEMRATRPLKDLSAKELVVSETDWPFLICGTACSGTSMRIHKGFVRTMVAIFVVVETYAPRSTGRSSTKPSIGDATTVYESVRCAMLTCVCAFVTLVR